MSNLNAPGFFPPEQDAQLRALWADGLSSKAIGRIMGRTKNSILGRKNRLKLPERPSPIIAKGTRRVYNPTPNLLKGAREIIAARVRSKAPPKVRKSRALYAAPKQDQRTVPRGQDLRFMVATVSTTRVAGMKVTGATQAPVRLFDVPDDIPALREGCRWPMWPHAARPAVGEHLFCEAARFDLGHHYCPGHAERAFVCRSGVTA